ncbi:PQQ-dependent sugar dehydrogenase [Gammaproteobacteria bacterium]|nr:PQQ-dependent sugar dehydrogenase [Gammaproteobacteria bacterium]
MVNLQELKKKFKNSILSRINAFACFSLILFSTSIKAFDIPDIKLPDGFHISVLTSETPDARSMALGNNTLFVSTRREGKIYAVTNYLDQPKVTVIVDNLYMPNGIAFKNGDLYVAEIHRLLKFENIESNIDDAKYTIISDEFPTDQHHGWRYITFGPDEKLYIPIGSPCNYCDEPDYGVITRVNKDGSNKTIVARGMRNTVGITFHPKTNELWFTDNGRDMLGDDIPPGELNRVSYNGQHFGFPFCHGKNIKDPILGNLGSCEESTGPVQELDAHVAPLGLKFYTGSQFPNEYKNQIFIPEHGSWNRTKKSGYRITVVKLDGNNAISYETFADGWMKDETTMGRPVDIAITNDGSMLVSDDYNGVIYRITYNEKE